MKVNSNEQIILASALSVFAILAVYHLIYFSILVSENIMIYFLKGKVTMVDGDTVVVDVHDVGYQVLVSHISNYIIGDSVFLYTYNVVREDEQYLAGFSTIEEKKVFLSLIKVKGLGPKTVINAYQRQQSKVLEMRLALIMLPI